MAVLRDFFSLTIQKLPARRGKGRDAWMSLRAAKVQRWALLRRENRQIHPEVTSVRVRI
jgi:hypothetical protein